MKYQVAATRQVELPDWISVTQPCTQGGTRMGKWHCNRCQMQEVLILSSPGASFAYHSMDEVIVGAEQHALTHESRCVLCDGIRAVHKPPLYKHPYMEA